jgi:outer membrane protein OmpA-like peptidoglycan-associated protein
MHFTAAMKRTSSWIVGLVVGVALLVAPGLAAADDTTRIQGNIILNQGQHITVRGGGADTVITLTPTTVIQSVGGVFGGQRKTYQPSDLIAGLSVNVDTVQNGSEVDAVKITFKTGDLKDAMAAQAAMYPEQQKLAAARQKLIAAQAETEKRLSEVGQFVQKGVTRVYFATGSSKINAQGQQDLQSIAAQGAGMPGGLFRIVGHTDSTGSPEVNQRLSSQRASAVTAYLLQNCNVPPNKIMSSTGLGQDVPMDADDMGSAKNRRVAVFIMVSKASEGASQLPPSSAANPMAPPPPSSMPTPQ